MKTLTALIETANRQLGKVQDLRASFAGVLDAKPDPKTWSIAEVIQHLNLTFDLYLPRIVEGLKDAADAEEVMDEYPLSAMTALMIKGTAPKGNKRKWHSKTFKFFVPDVKNEEETFSRFEDQHRLFVDLLKRMRHKQHAKVKIVSAAGPMLKFRLGEAAAFLLAHQERHLVQADEVGRQLIAAT